MAEWAPLLAALTAPEPIGMDAVSMLWMFPLVAAIAMVYKATKMRVLFLRRFLIESLVLFATVSGFMIMAILVLNLLSWLVTG
ncbi:MAG: hypothetical protein L0Y36_03480 [Planctomycetales bacterium]|nr:hypothetical protein [Planctomycetales bacterium]